MSSEDIAFVVAPAGLGVVIGAIFVNRVNVRIGETRLATLALVGDRAQLPAVGRGGVLDMAVQYAKELRTSSVRINVVDPGFTDTDMTVGMGNATRPASQGAVA